MTGFVVVWAAGGSITLGSEPVALAVLVVLFGASFFFSGSETAYFSLQKVDLEWFSRSNASGRQVSWLLGHRAPLITTILLGNETANIAISATCAGLISAWLPTMPWLNVLILTPVLVLVSEITPKVLAFRFRRSWARTAAWPLTAFFWAVMPARVVLSWIVGALASALGASREVAEGMRQEELMVYVDHGAAVGALDPLERDIIEAVFEFDGMTVERLMTPRPDVFSVPLTIDWQDLLDQARLNGHSRIPITGSHSDDIMGVLLLKDLLRFRQPPADEAVSNALANGADRSASATPPIPAAALGAPPGPRQLRSLLLPPVFVPASKPADSMLEEFLERRFHMAFVVDEHGTLVGLVTLDDLLRELLGEDEITDDGEIARLRPDTLTVKASIDVEDFSEETGIHLPEGDYHTLGGFVFHELGRLPRKGDAVAHGDHRFVVAKMEGRRIAEVVVRSPAVGQEAV
ncbi:MAG: hemolysin family protein [Myxococcales bacterium]|nr:hemolysin family protein [Myxococcales bacterium]